MFNTDPTEKVNRYVAFDDEGYDDEVADEQDEQSDEHGDLGSNRGTRSNVRIVYRSKGCGRGRSVPRL